MSSFRFDAGLCMGCYACETACKMWHGRSALERGNRQILSMEEGTFPDVKRSFKSIPMFGCDLCQSCGGFPHCALTCPTGALRYE